MKVSELLKELKKMPKDAEVYLCKDWDELDEENCLIDLYRLNDVCEQVPRRSLLFAFAVVFGG